MYYISTTYPKYCLVDVVFIPVSLRDLPKKTSFNPPPARILRPTRRRRNTGHTKSGKQAQHSAAFAGSSGSLKSRTVSSMMPGRAQPKLRREAIVAFSWRSRQQALGWWILGHGIWYWLVVSIPLKNISQLGWLFPIYGKLKNVPNHQPG